MRTEEDIKNAVEVLRRGGVILYPTDTVWGIGCDATNAEAVRRVYDIKQRDDSKALICLVDSDARLQRYVRQVPDVAWQLIDSLKDSGAKPTTLILDGAVNLAPNLTSCATGSSGRWSPRRRTSAASLPPRTTATSTRASSSLSTMSAGRVVRSTSLTRPAASSACVRTAR